MDVVLSAGKAADDIVVEGKIEHVLPELDFSNAKPDDHGVLQVKSVGGMKDMTWCPGARHTLRGKIVLHGYIFISNSENPLVFRVVQNRGYVY